MSYTNSLNTFERNIKKYPSIKVAIDLHRDAPYVDRIRSRELTTVKIDGKDVARIMLVVGTDKLFHHPNWKKNYRFALKIQEKMEELYPGLGRQINIRDERFNQHLLDKSLLVEIGSHGNTLEEALRSARLFADVVAQVLKELSQKD
jgi:stage II sporulation protein P